jgi:hypothetical protein
VIPNQRKTTARERTLTNTVTGNGAGTPTKRREYEHG